MDGLPAGYIENFKTGYKRNWKFQLSKDDMPINEQKQLVNQKMKFNEKNLKRELELLNLQKKTALRLEK